MLAFPLAFVAHDLEEVLTAAGWSETAASRLARRHPALARAVARTVPVSTKEMALAVGIVAVGVGGVTFVSLRNLDGDLRVFRTIVAAFSGHSVSHIGASVLFRGYTPGVVTVPLVIVPYSLWAGLRLRRSGLAQSRAHALRAARRGAALALPFALVGHVVARAVFRSRGE